MTQKLKIVPNGPIDIDEALNTDPDFIDLEEYDFSLDKLLEEYPEGVPLRVISAALGLSVKETEELYEGILEKLK